MRKGSIRCRKFKCLKIRTHYKNWIKRFFVIEFCQIPDVLHILISHFLTMSERFFNSNTLHFISDMNWSIFQFQQYRLAITGDLVANLLIERWTLQSMTRLIECADWSLHLHWSTLIKYSPSGFKLCNFRYGLCLEYL